MNKLLELKNISLSYDNKKTYIFKDISFWVFEWEILSIIWLNWSWKSSLLKIIAWINKPTFWNIIKNFSRLSYVPQKIDIDKTIPITVYEFLKIYNKNVSKDDILNSLKEFNWVDLIDKKIWNLSWGELQKVLIISSILSNPDLILLDEPTAWIDIIWEEIFYEIIFKTKELFPKLSIILVSHNINLVYKNSSKVICLHKDDYCCHWTPNEVFKTPIFTNIFWKYLSPYKHNPHSKNTH